MKILDCTLRDGGYYTNWDFNKSLVNQYIESLNHLPVDYIEIGYRNVEKSTYFGKYYYSPIFELEDIRKKSTKKLVVILNEKDILISDLEILLKPIVGLIDMIRLAIDPNHLKRAANLAKEIKKYGFEVGFNVMYMSKWKGNTEFLESLKDVEGVADYFYMVDSYGGVFPDDVKETIKLVRQYISCPLGFHGHNNLELALINTITALENGVEMVDSTILGMGRGAGNLKTELLLTTLNKKHNLEVNYNYLEQVVSTFIPLSDKYEWGTNLPYMISGSNSLPQKDVMDWVTTRYYSLDSIVRAMDNKKNNKLDNDKYPKIKYPKAEKVLIVGGGPSIQEHIDGILYFLANNPEIVIIHASSKNAKYFEAIKNQQYFCLVGNEGKRLEMVFDGFQQFSGTCILPPYPRKMGTYVPNKIINQTFELEDISFTDKYTDAHTSIALQIALNLDVKTVFLAGYDGYSDMVITTKEKNLIEENAYLFDILKKNEKCNLKTITPTFYSNIEDVSVYSL